MKIILATINARYAHTALGLRYLYANLGQHQPNAVICEYTLEQRAGDIAEDILMQNPDVVCLGIYIWNVHLSETVAEIIKSVRPNVRLIIGGPEVSYEQHLSPIVTLADYVICGWGEASLPKLLTDIANHRPPVEKIIQGIQLPLDEIKLPYDYYTDTDLAQRTLYIEASRGCPFKCEFCLSSLDKTAWPFDLDTILAELEKLFQRGARSFKFVDRTFNLKVANSACILRFFLDKIATYPDEKIFAHFEVVPDYLPEELKALIQAFPPGSLQLEVGIQTLNRDVQKNISRRTHLGKAKQSIEWLSTQTGVHLHVDLIAGLPGEDLASFARGFDELWSWQPQEIQLGVLKRLKGTPITRHNQEFQFVYSQQAPFTVLQNRDLDYLQLQQINRLARFWDLIGNSGRFSNTLPVILRDQPFANIWALSEWLYHTIKQTHQIALDRLMKLIFEWLLEQGIEKQQVIDVISADFMQTGIQGWPRYLGEPPADWRAILSAQAKNRKGNARQERHRMSESG